MTPNLISAGYLVSGLPHLLLKPNLNEGWAKLRAAMDKVRADIEKSDAELILIYSTYWASVVGHQVQARAKPKFVHVDEEFHDLGSIPYEFSIDTKLAASCVSHAKKRGLQARTIDYEGFPIDTGSVVALKLLNPNNDRQAVIVSSNVYADRAETLIFGKAARDAIEESGKKTIVIAVSSLSNRLQVKSQAEEEINSLKDDEWNRKFLEFLSAGRLEDVSQLSRQFHREARVPKVTNFKPFWWMASVMGQTNCYTGEVLEYQSVCGTGNAVVGLTPTTQASRDLEFDEDDVDTFKGDRNVLAPADGSFSDFARGDEDISL